MCNMFAVQITINVLQACGRIHRHLILKIVDGVPNNGFFSVMTQKNTRYRKNKEEEEEDREEEDGKTRAIHRCGVISQWQRA